METLIKNIKDAAGNTIYPITKMAAVYNESGQTLDAVLENGGGSSGGGTATNLAETNAKILEVRDAVQKRYDDNIKLKVSIGPLQGDHATIEASPRDTRCISRINFISNDSEEPMQVTFYNINGNSSTILLKKGEVIDDLDCWCTGLDIYGDNYADYRVLYTETDKI